MPICHNKHWILLTITGLKSLNQFIISNPGIEVYPKVSFEMFDPLCSSPNSLQKTATYADLMKHYIGPCKRGGGGAGGTLHPMG